MDVTMTLSQELPQRLLAWYDATARVLPWRDNTHPYRVWVSEIMLQQTRVEAVIPYYQRFMEQLPTVQALAEAPEEKLLKLWEGLGYYNRVRNLQKGAWQVMEVHGGEIPGDYKALLALPGVGAYTAGAIGSISFGLRVPAVDGNVLRVIARVLASREDVTKATVKQEVEQAVTAILPARVGDFNQSLMELGAMICLPNGEPKCGDCPLASLCQARALGIQQTLPVKTPKKPRRVELHTVFLLTCKGKLALWKRPDTGLLSGMWELPSAPGHLGEEEARLFLKSHDVGEASLEPLPQAKHIFTHVEWHMTGYGCQVVGEAPEFTWVTREALEEVHALPSAFKGFSREIRERMG